MGGGAADLADATGHPGVGGWRLAFLVAVPVGLVGLGLVAAVSLSFNTFFIFLPGQLSTELGIPLPRALAGALLGMAVMAARAPASDAAPTGWFPRSSRP